MDDAVATDGRLAVVRAGVSRLGVAVVAALAGLDLAVAAVREEAGRGAGVVVFGVAVVAVLAGIDEAVSARRQDFALGRAAALTVGRGLVGVAVVALLVADLD